MLPPPPSRSRRRASPGLTNSVWHVVSRDFPLPNIYVRYAQPFGRGSCKEKKIRLRWQPTAAQPGSALTKIAGGHLGEPPTPRLVLLACLLFPAGAAAPCTAAETGGSSKSRKAPLSKQNFVAVWPYGRAWGPSEIDHRQDRGQFKREIKSLLVLT